MMSTKDALYSFAEHIQKEHPYYLRRPHSFPEEWHNLKFTFLGHGDYMVVFRYRDLAIKIPKNSDYPLEKDKERLLALKPWTSYEKYVAHSSNWIATRFIQGERLDKLWEEDRLVLTDEAILHLEFDLRHSMITTAYLPWDVEFFNLIKTPQGQLKLIDTGEFLNRKELPIHEQREAFQASLSRINKSILQLSEHVNRSIP
ncbi:hypothetical protein F9B85_05260 [Heliorestis acidaminivorans]|uniref:Uncharacterized protein n=1 Tax=Heliorestis acidaminivorans TaxID=553427 RepID=A0A6I0EY36_9FIRM|nr:hypothetical protein [Heliorestis acidaminivorans]KAB2953321.1 hypothetical protein F9B85_05260 [Heliorestis acidaminivorans]